MRLLDGTKTATERKQQLAERLAGTLGLGIIVANSDPATRSYIASKHAAAEGIGMEVTLVDLGGEATQEEVVAACRAFNDDSHITGYIVQLPLPEGVDQMRVFSEIDPSKDADGLTPLNLGFVALGHPRIIPATPKGVLTLLDAYGIELRGTQAVMVGKGLLTGLPLSSLLAHRGATVTLCDSHTPDIAEHTRQAEILISATGVPGLITADMVRENAVVVDIGTVRQEEGLKGDVAFDEVAPKTEAITPVPGGVGPMTVVSLLENVYELSKLPQNTH